MIIQNWQGQIENVVMLLRLVEDFPDHMQRLEWEAEIHMSELLNPELYQEAWDKWQREKQARRCA